MRFRTLARKIHQKKKQFVFFLFSCLGFWFYGIYWTLCLCFRHIRRLRRRHNLTVWLIVWILDGIWTSCKINLVSILTSIPGKWHKASIGPEGLWAKTFQEGNGYETRQNSLLYVFCSGAFFGLDRAQNTIVVYSVLRRKPIGTCWSRNSWTYERKQKIVMNLGIFVCSFDVWRKKIRLFIIFYIFAFAVGNYRNPTWIYLV